MWIFKLGLKSFAYNLALIIVTEKSFEHPLALVLFEK